MFEKQNEYTLSKLAEGDGAAFKKWLDDHPDFKEEFFIAALPEDDFTAAYKILQTLHDKFKKGFDEYGQLAIATALVWDKESNIDHYDDHQRRTHSNMPAKLLGTVENFQYFIEMSEVMQGRAQYLPWEFQVFMINEKTPRAEREWAAQNLRDSQTCHVRQVLLGRSLRSRNAANGKPHLSSGGKGLFAAEHSAVRRRLLDAGGFCIASRQEHRRPRCVCRRRIRGRRPPCLGHVGGVEAGVADRDLVHAGIAWTLSRRQVLCGEPCAIPRRVGRSPIARWNCACRRSG